MEFCEESVPNSEDDFPLRGAKGEDLQQIIVDDNEYKELYTQAFNGVIHKLDELRSAIHAEEGHTPVQRENIGIQFTGEPEEDDDASLNEILLEFMLLDHLLQKRLVECEVSLELSFLQKEE